MGIMDEAANARHKKNLERIKRFRLLDDDFMTKCFEGQIEATELLIHVILNVNWRVLEAKTQDTIKNLQGRSVRLDIHAVTEDARQVNIEIQRQDKGAGAKRARYNASVLDANALPVGDACENLPEIYVIFVTEIDVLGMGEPIYFIERHIEGKNIRFNDGSHIVYVNNEIQDINTPLGRLMHDFACTDAKDMYYGILADRVRYFKETEEGVANMCKAMEEIREEGRMEGREEGRMEMARNLILMGDIALEKIAQAAKLPLEEVQKIAKGHFA